MSLVLVAISISLAAATKRRRLADDVFFDIEKDLLVLHYDHAPDRDDGHSAALDRTMLEGMYCCSDLNSHVLAVGGTYGRCEENCNIDLYDAESEAVMDTVWTDDCGGWLNAHADWQGSKTQAVARWRDYLASGGRVFVKEGGQSDFTYDVISTIRKDFPDEYDADRVHVVQHSDWNERHTTQRNLSYVQNHTIYTKISDANRYLKVHGTSDDNLLLIDEFIEASQSSSQFGAFWTAAFDYYTIYIWGDEEKDKPVIDASDTGELMEILGLHAEFSELRWRQRPTKNSTCMYQDLMKKYFGRGAGCTRWSSADDVISPSSCEEVIDDDNQSLAGEDGENDGALGRVGDLPFWNLVTVAALTVIALVLYNGI